MSAALRRSALAATTTAALLAVAAGPARAAYTAKVQGGTLTLTGNAASDKLALRLGGSPTTLQVDVGDDGTADFSFDRTTFTAIDVEAGGGNDELRVDQSGGAFTDEAVTLSGGGGNDTLLGGAGADVLLGGAGDDFADGNQGVDRASLGGGNDRFQWDPGDGSDTVDGDGGDDRLDFNGSNIGEHIAVSAAGSRVRLTRDVAAIAMDLGGLEHTSIRLLGGADTVTVDDLTGTDVKTVDVDLDAIGGGGDGSADTVVVNGTAGADRVTLGSVDGRIVAAGPAAQTRVLGGESATDSLTVAGLGGADTLTLPAGTPGAIPVVFDGGADTDTARLDGTPGDDLIQIVRNGTVASTLTAATARLDTTTTVESLVISGLAGNDTLTAGNGLAALTTTLTLDGGDGNDTLAGSDGADTLLGGKGNDLVDGNIGADQAQLGAGDDHFQWDPGDGNDTVDGQNGTDQLDFNGSNIGEHINLTPNGTHLRLTRDIAAINLDLTGIKTANLRTLGGADTVTVDDLTGTDVKTVDVDLDAIGGGGDGSADTVVVNGTSKRDVVKVTRTGAQVSVAGLPALTRIVGGEPALDTLLVRTLAGNDDVTVAPDVSDLIATIVDLGTDE